MRAIAFVLLSNLLAGCAGDHAPAYALLFGENESRLTSPEMQSIFSQMESAFPVSNDGTSLVDPNCGDIEPNAEVVDLNGDGSYEVFIEWGNSCLSGSTGRSLTLFVKDSSGSYRHQLGFPAFGYQPLERGADGFPDLQFGGPGFCFAVWEWTGTDYEFKCNQPQQAGGCNREENICQEN
jgi:hypothetical protein